MMNLKYGSCIEACRQCATACNLCFGACLKEEDAGDLSRCMALDIDCAQACQMAAAAMERDSELAPQVCSLCADICQACEDECARHPMEHCRSCAEACGRCAYECRRMARPLGEPRMQPAGMRASHH